MHILAFEEQPTAFAGGQERSLFEVLHGLAERGCKTSLCYREEGDLLRAYKGFLKAWFCIKSRRFTRPFHPLISDIFKLYIRFRVDNWDVLYANQYFDTPVVASLGILCGIPAVCHLRLACPEYLSRQYRWGLKQCTKIIANSNYTKDTYVNAGLPEELISVVYNGVDTNWFSPLSIKFSGSLWRRPSRIAYFGRLCPSKGVEVLLHAFKLIDRKTEPMELHIIGNVRSPYVGPEYLTQLKEIAASDLETAVVFKPHIEDIRAELAVTDLVVLPSMCKETFGRTLIEAMSCGVPVIASS